jgi:hypothetical protein
MKPLNNPEAAHRIGWLAAMRACWRWRPRRSWVLAGVLGAILFNITAAWAICSTFIPWHSDVERRVWNVKRIGDSHLVWFVGRRGGYRESFFLMTDGPAAGKDAGAWFDHALPTYEAASAGQIRAAPPGWGPLAVAWSGGDPYAGLVPSLRGTPHWKLSSLTRAQFATGWPFVSMGYWFSDASPTVPERYLYFYGWRPSWYARLAPNRFWALPLHPIWPGFLANGLLCFATVLLPCMLVSTLRRATRLRRGRCPSCCYDLTGLPPGSPCPECAARPED